MKRNNLFWTGYGFCYDDRNETLWFTDYWSNVLCEYSLEDFRFRSIIPIQSEDNYQFRSVCYFSDILIVDSRLFLLPSSSNHVVVYDRKENVFSHLVLDNIRAEYNKCGFFERLDDRLFAFPHMDNGIYSIGLNDYSQCELARIDNEINAPSDIISRFQIKHYRENNKVYLLSAIDNKVFRFDLETGGLETFCVGNSNDIYNTIDGIGYNMAILSTQNGEFVLMDFLTMKVMDTISKPSGLRLERNMDPRGPLFADSIVKGNTVWYFPCQANMIVGVSLNDHRSWCINTCCFEEYDDYNEGWEVAGYSAIKETRFGNVGFFRRKGLLFLVDDSMKNWRVLSNRFDMDRELLHDLMNEFETSVIYEQARKIYSLPAFIRYLEVSNMDIQ